jgi:hypothetical protein
MEDLHVARAGGEPDVDRVEQDARREVAPGKLGS